MASNIKSKSYTFFVDEFNFQTIETKDGVDYYVTGYISTKDQDLVNDIVTEKALSGMLQQVLSKNVKLDVEHEAWKEENPTIIPIGRIIEAKKDERGLFIKAVLNKAHSRFKEVWESIRSGFLDAFSIAYVPLRYAYKTINGIKTRLLEEVELLNVAITGNPVNPECRMLEVFTKSLNEIETEDKMSEEIKAKKEKKQDEEDNIEDEEKPEEENKQEAEEEEEEEEKKCSKKKSATDELKEQLEIKSKGFEKEIKSLKELNEALQTEVKALKEQLDKPVFKSLMDKEEVEKKDFSNPRAPLDII